MLAASSDLRRRPPLIISVIRQQLTDKGMNAFPVTGWAVGIVYRAIPHLGYALARYVTCPSSKTGDQNGRIFFGTTLAVLPFVPQTKHTDAPL
jgi:hypothetical protein